MPNSAHVMLHVLKIYIDSYVFNNHSYWILETGFGDDLAALCDLFSHYMEAWKSWFVDAIGKQKMQQTCWHTNLLTSFRMVNCHSWRWITLFFPSTLPHHDKAYRCTFDTISCYGSRIAITGYVTHTLEVWFFTFHFLWL